MTWTYQQSTGKMSHNGEYIATGYAGIGADCNNPASQDVPFKGPLPQGSYTIDAMVADGGHMGPYILPLTPWPNNNMFGRSGFYIHGDTAARDQTASNGCIVLDRQYRMMIAQSGDNVLTVTA